MQSRRRPCGDHLFYLNAEGQPTKLPRKEYPYNSLKKHLEALFSRPGFEQRIQEWKHRNKQGDVLYDIYDGAMWSALPDPHIRNRKFVDYGRALQLTLNVDWFKPFRGS